MVNQKQFIPGIQLLRGIAALAVVFCHYGSSINNFKLLSSFFNYGKLGIYIFFLISGYIIVYSLEASNYKPRYFFKFILKRSVRIDPLYIITIILTLLSFWLLSLLPSYKGFAIPFIPSQFLAHVFYLIPFSNWGFYSSVFWTLCVEFQFYLLIVIFYFINDSIIYRTIFWLFFH